MRFFKNLGRGIQNVAKGITRGISTAEKVINTIDKHTGLRQIANVASGGLSEVALKSYNKFKKPTMTLLDTVAQGDQQKALSQGAQLGKDIYKYSKTKPFEKNKLN